MSEYWYRDGIDMPSDNALLFRAVSSAMPIRKTRGGVPLWKAVQQTFQLDESRALALCERFRLDPEQRTQR